MSVILVSATGGHLAELHQLVKRLEIPVQDRLWVTFDSEQSRELLRDERVAWAVTTPPRDLRAVVANVPLAQRLYSRHRVEAVISNGAGIALAFLPLASARGIPAHYIECAARTQGPSLTGRVLELAVPRVNLYAQYPRWASGRWRYEGSVLDSFAVRGRPEPATVRRVLVTVGTLFPFRRLVERLRAIIPDDVDVVWQVGATPVADLPIEAHRSLTPQRLAEEAAKADVVIAHAGIGSALMALNSGRVPILVPREVEEGEHVDNHQEQIAHELDGRGLGVAAGVGELEWDDLLRAASLAVDVPESPPPFALRPGRAARRPTAARTRLRKRPSDAATIRDRR